LDKRRFELNFEVFRSFGIKFKFLEVDMGKDHFKINGVNFEALRSRLKLPYAILEYIFVFIDNTLL